MDFKSYEHFDTFLSATVKYRNISVLYILILEVLTVAELEVAFVVFENISIIFRIVMDFLKGARNSLEFFPKRERFGANSVRPLVLGQF